MDALGCKLVWYPDSQHGFAIGKLVDIGADKAGVQPLAYPPRLCDSSGSYYHIFEQQASYFINNNNNNKNVPIFEFPYSAIYPFDKLTAEQLIARSYKDNELYDVEDNCALVQMNEASLLDNIRLRFKRNKIYTYVAHILVAVNPYAQIRGLHSEQALADYQGKSLGTLAPHVYAIADKAFRDMKASKQSQSIIISGESGAGKTETQKYVLRYLCLRAAHKGRLEKLILDANPLLEAFGNAKTTRNNNSSRFGKFIQLHYARNFCVSGAQFLHYLLEKSRICLQSKSERNYHIFYQLCAALPENEWRKLRLASPDKFRYLSGGCAQYFGSPQSSIAENRLSLKDNKLLNDDLIDDVRCFEQTSAALDNFGVDAKLKFDIYKIVAAVLHLGNIEFIDSGDSTGGCAVKEGEEEEENGALRVAADLLELDAGLLRESLVSRIMSTSRGGGSKGTIYMVQLTQAQAQAARDALAKAIYAKLFDFIVARVVNASMPTQLDSSTTTTTTTTTTTKGEAQSDKLFIGVLDVAGFEYFERNSFEQLLINFCNERLQAFFNERVMKFEQSIYESEGLCLQRVEFRDNSDAIDLFEAKSSGIFHLLDDESRLPRPSAQHFAQSVHAANNTKQVHNRATSTNSLRLDVPRASKQRAHRELRDDEGILVRHFAGAVCYETAQFIEKNNDALHQSLRSLMLESNTRLLREMFDSTLSTNNDSSDDSAKQAIKFSCSQQSTNSQQQNQKLNFVSVGSTFRRQLGELMGQLEATGSHFVRCIKPNSEMVARQFDGASIAEQLHCSGMHSVLKLMHGGFPSRVSFLKLYETYAPLLPPRLARLDSRLFCRALFKALGLRDADFKFGATRVFFKSGKFAQFDTLVRQDSRQHLEALIARAEKWLCSARWRKAQFVALVVVKLRNSLAARRTAIVRLQQNWRRAIVLRSVGARLLFVRRAKSILKSVAEFSALIGSDSLKKLADDQRVLLAEESKQLCADLSKLIGELKTQLVAKNSTGQYCCNVVAKDEHCKRIAQLDALATKRDLLLRAAKNKMRQAEELAELEARAARERQRRAEDEQRLADERQARDERAQLDARWKQQQSANESSTKQKTCTVDVGTDPISLLNDVVNDREATSLANSCKKTTSSSEHRQAGPDLSKWKYSELRDTINTSCDLKLLDACKREFHRRLKVYHAWKAANSRRESNSSGAKLYAADDKLRAPSCVLQQAQSSDNDDLSSLDDAQQQKSLTSITTESKSTENNNNNKEQRYFRIPFSRNASPTNCGWWFAHFDGQWIARQLELHPGKLPILLIAGRDDMAMCELSLRETRLAQRRGAEISAREFEAEWIKNGGKRENVATKTSPTATVKATGSFQVF